MIAVVCCTGAVQDGGTRAAAGLSGTRRRRDRAGTRQVHAVTAATGAYSRCQEHVVAVVEREREKYTRLLQKQVRSWERDRYRREQLNNDVLTFTGVLTYVTDVLTTVSDVLTAIVCRLRSSNRGLKRSAALCTVTSRRLSRNRSNNYRCALQLSVVMSSIVCVCPICVSVFKSSLHVSARYPSLSVLWIWRYCVVMYSVLVHCGLR